MATFFIYLMTAAYGVFVFVEECGNGGMSLKLAIWFLLGLFSIEGLMSSIYEFLTRKREQRWKAEA